MSGQPIGDDAAESPTDPSWPDRPVWPDGPAIGRRASSASAETDGPDPATGDPGPGHLAPTTTPFEISSSRNRVNYSPLTLTVGSTS